MEKTIQDKFELNAAEIDRCVEETAELLDQLESRPVRLIGAGFHNLESEEGRQLRLEEVFGEAERERDALVRERLSEMEARYGLDLGAFLTGTVRSGGLYQMIETMRLHG